MPFPSAGKQWQHRAGTLAPLLPARGAAGAGVEDSTLPMQLLHIFAFN